MKASCTVGMAGQSWLFFLLVGAVFGLPGTLLGQSPRFESVSVDAFDPDAWNGIVFLARAFNQPANFALRVGSRSGGFLDGDRVFAAVGEVGLMLPMLPTAGLVGGTPRVKRW